MRVLYAGASLLIITLSMALGLGNAPVAAAYKPQVLISHIQVRSDVAASHEAVTIFNNSEYVADITGWCIYYTSATSNIASPPTGISKLFCFNQLTDNEFLLLDGYGSVTIFSTNYIESKNLDEADSKKFLTFGKSLSDVSGHLYLLDKSGVEQDRVGWGSASFAAGSPATSIPSGSILQRLTLDDGTHQNTMDNSVDFETIEGNLYDNWLHNDLTIALDLCESLAGVQFEIPDGYQVSENGCLVVDNEEGPVEEGGNDEVDPAINEDQNPETENDEDRDDSSVINPDKNETINYQYGVVVNEILPNPSGVDGGNEYIELYNSNSFSVDISGYVLRAGISDASYSYYTIPSDVSISPGGFWVIYSQDFNFNLVNKTGQVSLLFDSALISQSDVYYSAPDNKSWSLIDGKWSYTKILTPGAPNMVDQIQKIELASSSANNLRPCAPNQYRSPETNRCRAMAQSSTLTPCREGQERNPETNRCKSVISSQSELSPCKEGQERNPETNRCRQVLSASIPSADYPVEPIEQVESASFGWWIAAAVVILGLGYAVWEWRGGIYRLYRTVRLKVRSLGQ